MPRLPSSVLPALAALALSVAGAAAQGAVQGAAPRPGDQKAAPKAAADTVIGCTSLANLRSLLLRTGEDRAAALALIRDPKSDLGCNALDRAAVTEIADHVSLNGRAYDCLTLKGMAVCHWTVAGAVTPPERPAAKPQKGK
ncbi:MAG TPA: hypothetical protein K8W01_16650 [Methylorubrum populi]|uniref:Secreted protein n=1 Tax=Methylorubrum populi TaxID=223967 RepID=A0A921E584_9HYPH|nr:hypothetical protein [Methylorubrum populi]